MKAWIVREKGEFFCAVVFAETRSKAKVAAMSTDVCENADYVDIMVRRAPTADQYYKPGKRELNWYDAEDRIVMVRDLGFTCDYDGIDPDACARCPARDYCDYYADMDSEEAE